MRHDILVLGGGPVGHALAAQFGARDHTVAFVDDDARTIDRARDAGVTAHEAPLETAANPHGLAAATVVAATSSDARNLLLAGAATRAFGADRTVALVNEAANLSAFDDAGVETVHVPAAVAGETAGRVGDPSAAPPDERPRGPADDPPDDQRVAD